jgi:hypothetical protein
LTPLRRSANSRSGNLVFALFSSLSASSTDYFRLACAVSAPVMTSSWHSQECNVQLKCRQFNDVMPPGSRNVSQAAFVSAHTPFPVTGNAAFASVRRSSDSQSHCRSNMKLRQPHAVDGAATRNRDSYRRRSSIVTVTVDGAGIEHCGTKVGATFTGRV